MTSQGDKEVVFGAGELSKDEEERYRSMVRKSAVEAAKGSTPVGGIPRPSIPPIQNQPIRQNLEEAAGVQPRPPGSPVLSARTASQIAEMQKDQASQRSAEEEASEKKPVDDDLWSSLLDLGQGQNEADRILMNKKRRQEIESRCEAMNFEDLLLKNEVRQVVPVIPGKFEPMFRSTTPEEQLFIRQFIAKEDRDKTQGYVDQKFGLCQLACAIVSINGIPFPSHLDDNGVIRESLFVAKLKQLMKKSGYIINDLGVQYTWFDLRVRKLLAPDTIAEKVGNG